MDSCPPRENLRRLLCGADGPETDRERGHVQECRPCQAVLDELSDDEELRNWWRLAVKGSPTVLEPGLARVLDGAGTTPREETPWPRRIPVALGPPRVEGDLGSLGNYRIEAVLGRGGMGIVYRAFDETLRRVVAIKILSGDGEANANARLVREARAAAGLRHDHIVAIHAVFDPPEASAYLVMEYLAGPTLSARESATVGSPRAGPPRSSRRPRRDWPPLMIRAWSIVTSSRATSCSSPIPSRPRQDHRLRPGSDRRRPGQPDPEWLRRPARPLT